MRINSFMGNNFDLLRFAVLVFDLVSLKFNFSSWLKSYVITRKNNDVLGSKKFCICLFLLNLCNTYLHHPRHYRHIHCSIPSKSPHYLPPFRFYFYKGNKIVRSKVWPIRRCSSSFSLLIVKVGVSFYTVLWCKSK